MDESDTLDLDSANYVESSDGFFYDDINDIGFYDEIE